MSRPPIKPETDRYTLGGDEDLLLEFVCWFMTICALPLWMAARGHNVVQFAIFCAGAALLLAAGSILSGSFPARGRREVLELIFSAWLGIALVGGALFGLANLVRLIFL
ncbi:MAG TPA: hypothetical protein VNT25_04245 [Allosphingosinicella sp.]|nr:hypothetical protein [Allosphingosinicella sp.]